MQHLTVEQLRNKLASLKACTNVSIRTETFPTLIKKNRKNGNPNPYEVGDISEISYMAGPIGASYQNAVNNQLGREDKELDFVERTRTWGELMDNKVLVYYYNEKKHTENYYLQIIVKTADDPIYLWGEEEISVEDLTGFLKKKTTPKTQKNLEKKVIIKDITLENIKYIKMLGDIYAIGDYELPRVASVKSRTDAFETPMPQKREEAKIEKGIRKILTDKMEHLLEID